MTRIVRLVVLVGVCSLTLRIGLAADPSSAWLFRFNAPLPQWKNGLPIGNGRIGAQSWGTGPALFLTLDRSDVWDLRYAANHSANFNYARLREFVREQRHDLIQQELSPDVGPTADRTPYHLGIGRLGIELPADTTVDGAELDMYRAEVRWGLRVHGKPVTFRVWASATQDVIVATLDGLGDYRPHVGLQALTEIQQDLARKLSYEKPTRGEDGVYAWVIQPVPESGRIATIWRTDAQADHWQLLLSIAPQDASDPLATARRTLEAASRLGVARLSAQHRSWWQERWGRSAVELPDQELQRLWRNGIYKLASSSHLSVPANLQGLWPPDGEFPPWRGDYHCDMDVQETYWPAYSSNQLDLAEPLNRWLLEKVAPQAESLTQQFFGVDGLWMGTMYDPQGRMLGGPNNWLTAQYWIGGGGWMAQHLWWYYRYSGDEAFLRQSAYPFMKKCLQFYERILTKADDGRWHIAFSQSPEYFSNDLKAWTPDPTCDLSIVRNLARYSLTAAEVLHTDEAELARWQAFLADLAPYPTDVHSGLKVQPDTTYNHTHRHPMHLFPIFPGGDLNVEGSVADRALIDRSMKNWIYQGTGEWMGWSFPYGSLIASRVRRANQALSLLQIYTRAYIWPNGFHVNGDYRRFGFSFYDSEAFTMEAECGFTAAVNEMLLQSWGGRVRIFPSVPAEWEDVSFRNLRAEGGFLVSAERRHGQIMSATIESEKGGVAKVVWPLGYVAPGQPFAERVIKLAPGDTMELVHP
jgi:alpha-L-fucosidase 2